MMATKSKEVSVKEKRPSSSHLQRQGYQKLVVSKLESEGGSQSGKPLPNYLKPTFSSRPEITTKYVRKSSVIHGNDTSANQKARTQRRKSFDRASCGSSSASKDAADPPVRAHPHKSSAPPLNRAASSISRAGKTSVNHLKPQAEGAVSRTLRRNTSDINSAPVSSATSPTKCDDSHENLIADDQTPKSHQEDLVHDNAEEIDKGLSIVQTLIQEVGEIETGIDEDVEHYDDLDGLEGNSVVQIAQVDEDRADNDDDGEKSPTTEKDDEQVVFDSETNQKKENEEDAHHSNSNPLEQTPIERMIPEDEGAVDDVNGVEDEPERQEKEVTEPEGTSEKSAFVQLQKKQVNLSKKELPSAYNDVIEETKNKLLETRKNKVKALVGAFETVIDYESATK